MQSSIYKAKKRMNTQTTPSRVDIKPSDVVRRDSDGTVVVPAVLAGRCLASRSRPLRTLDEHPVRVAVASELVQQQMLERAREASPILWQFADGEWWRIFESAADEMERWVNEDTLASAFATASACGGLPPRRIERGVLGVIGHLRRLPEILAAQAPGGRLTAFRDGVSGANWSWRPAAGCAPFASPETPRQWRSSGCRFSVLADLSWS